MPAFSDLLFPQQPGVKISLDIPTDHAIDMMAKALGEIMIGSGWTEDMPSFRYMTTVTGLPGSCRILMDRPFLDSVSLPTALTPTGLAIEFLTEFCTQARFPAEPPSERTGLRWSRCFEVRKYMHKDHVDGDHPAAFIFAGWMEHH